MDFERLCPEKYRGPVTRYGGAFSVRHYHAYVDWQVVVRVIKIDKVLMGISG